MREKILNLLNLTDEEKRAFIETAEGHEMIFIEPGPIKDSFDLPDELFRDVTVILGRPSEKQLSAARKLRWLQSRTAGVDNYLRPGVMPEGAMLTSAVGAYGQAVSEHMFAVLLSILKLLPMYRDEQRKHNWTDLGQVRSLSGMNVYILGTGDIGSAFAGLCRTFGSRTVGFRRDPSKPADGIDEMRAMEELDELLPEADVVVLFLPHTAETVHTINHERLCRMKPDAIVLNGGRGSAVDLEALCDALDEGRLWGAGLDVTEIEPLPPNHRLWDEERVLLTPHIAGFDHMDVIMRVTASIALENLRRYLAGEPLINRMA